MFSLESPYQGDSNEYDKAILMSTHNMHFEYTKENHPKLS